MSKILHIHQLSDYLSEHPHSGEQQLSAEVLVPSGDIGCYHLDVSEVPKRFLAQALPAMLEDLLVNDIDNQHICQGPQKRGKSLPVLAVQHEQMQQWVDSVSSSGIHLTGLYPDFYCLPFDDSGCSLYVNEGYAIVRHGLHQGFSGNTEEVTLLLAKVQKEGNINCYSDASVPLPETLSLVYRPALSSLSVNQPAINLCTGQYGLKSQASNPYQGWSLPIALVATFLVAFGLNQWSETRFYQQQNALIQPVIEQNYRQLFGQAAETGWQRAARYQTTLAQAQLNSGALSHWHLLKTLNQTLQNCRSCQLDELTLSKDQALLTVKKEGSDSLISAIQSHSKLVIEQQDALDTAISLKIKLAGA